MTGLNFTIDTYVNGIAYGKFTWPEKGLQTGAFSGPYVLTLT